MTVLDGAPSSTAADDSAASPPPAATTTTTTATGHPRSITFRSLFVGTLCVIAVCAGTPINDLIVSDTSLVAGFLPLAAVLLTFILVVGINAPLHRWAPRHALRQGELGVVLLMTLVSCGIPNWGLMRFLAPTPVAPFHLGASDERFWNAFTGMNLPGWLFPVDSVANGRTNPEGRAATWFYTRVPREADIPWTAWIVPMLAWGVFAAAMIATVVALGRLILGQWMTNERLPMPLVQVQAALIESPAPGFALNKLFRTPMLWIALGGVFAVLMLSCLNTYFPRYFPAIPLKYDFRGILSEEPLSFLRDNVKQAAVSFTVVGVTFFIRSRAAFSLWATYLFVNLIDVQQGMRQGEIPTGVWQDQHLGACIAFVAAIGWIGRHHWMRILRSAFGLRRRAADDGPYRSTFWVAAAGTVVMLAWLIAVGVRPWMAGLIVLFIVVAHVIVARVVAETGLPFYRTGINVQQVYSNLPAAMLGARDVYFASVFNVLGPLTTRDSVMTFAQHGLGVAASSGVDEKRQRGLGRVMAWALMIGFLVAAPATLWCHYSYPTPSSQEARPARNYFGAEYVQQRDVRNPVNDHSRGTFPAKAYSPAAQVATGFGITALLEFLSLRFAGWPLLPVGYVASHGAFMGNAWFSIFLGWLAQRTVVRLGGAKLFERARPFFIGIIFGECLAAGVWLLVNAIVVANGYESKAVTFLL